MIDESSRPIEVSCKFNYSKYNKERVWKRDNRSVRGREEYYNNIICRNRRENKSGWGNYKRLVHRWSQKSDE